MTGDRLLDVRRDGEDLDRIAYEDALDATDLGFDPYDQPEPRTVKLDALGFAASQRGRGRAACRMARSAR